MKINLIEGKSSGNKYEVRVSGNIHQRIKPLGKRLMGNFTRKVQDVMA